MRLWVDVYFDGEEDFEDMLEGIVKLANFAIEKHMERNDSESTSLFFPLGKLILTNEPNPVEPHDCEDCNDNINNVDSLKN